MRVERKPDPNLSESSDGAVISISSLTLSRTRDSSRGSSWIHTKEGALVERLPQPRFSDFTYAPPSYASTFSSTAPAPSLSLWSSSMSISTLFPSALVSPGMILSVSPSTPLKRLRRSLTCVASCVGHAPMDGIAEGLLKVAEYLTAEEEVKGGFGLDPLTEGAGRLGGCE